jgi:hypothetical protein
LNDRREIEWAPRVSLAKIRELYVNEARGTCSAELLNDVGYALFARCASILEFSQALEGEVTCKRCATAGKTTRIERRTKKPDELLLCPTCAWQVRWRVYLAESEKVDGQLDAGHAGDAFRRYTAVYPNCQSPDEKMLAIDRLIHEFHWILVEAGKDPLPHKPAGVNLLRGSATQVIDLLNELTYGDNTPPELLEGRDWWLAQKPIARRQKRKS